MKSNSVVCCICYKAYSTNYNLKRHYMSKHQQFKYKCSQCKKELSSKHCLKEHLFTHSLETPYKCPFKGCKERFRQLSHLSVHKKVHFSEQSRNIPSLKLTSLLENQKLSSDVLSSTEESLEVNLPEISSEPQSQKLPLCNLLRSK